MEQDVGTVAKRYSQLESERDTFLERGREAARLTIPTLLPEEGHSSSSIYATPYQGIGARGVNNLASKLLLALLPPNSPFFRLTIDDFDLQQLAGENRGQVEEGLARIERAAMQEIEGKSIRVPVFEALKLLIVTGNALVYMPKEGGMKVFRPDRYCAKRDTMGNVLEIITKESMAPSTLPDEVKDMIPPSDTPVKSYDLYTCLKRVDNRYEVVQEVAGITIEKTRGKFKLDQSPFIPLRFIRIDGEDYRKRDFEGHAVVHSEESAEAAANAITGVVARDSFAEVIAHLATIHPSRYVGLVEDLGAVWWSGVHQLHNQAEALRLVALVDRLYDQRVAIIPTGIPLDEVFDDTMLSGGYRKKYLRAVSRMIALTRLAVEPKGAM